ncbi:uncharacterized protein BDW47DRAFT_100554 [Aspergillus candidus]|uniref:Conserved oligomeric Golgi complex subunit 1 n=1 Tax=Aspergillus candidus TaxID=41067 RepID=A0A2I2FKK0_ASPCN|nr:hypothetical protein BDW47DRAFT_100554 [Aspergillus candidus]PLB41134.1 hypothetical protein BDW47DRAFT_100554 [Aspergillus candidus]
MASAGPDSQSLKSWQDAFQYPIPTVRRVEQELRRDIASNKEKLRALVGTRYRDLVGTAETIVSMNHDIQQVDSTLTDIGRRCNPRLMEKKHAHFNQIKGDVSDKDVGQRALAAQLSLLHRCATSISRQLRKHGSILLVAKLFVVSRLLHKTLSQQESVPPFLESLRNQLAVLRRTLLKRTKKRLASATSTIDEIIESLAAYCLATSSSSDDAIRHFHEVRLGVIGSQLESNDPSGENVLNALRLYVLTLQNSKILLSRRLSDVLAKLKVRPILTDPEIRGLDDLGLDVLGRWVAPEVGNFTPWIKLTEVSKSDAEKVIKQWSKEAFGVFTNGCQKALSQFSEFPALLSLRGKTLELWLCSWSSTPTHSSLQVLEGTRSVFNKRLTEILSDQAKALGDFGQSVASTISNWENKEHNAAQSLWGQETISLDYSNGGDAFKQAVADTLLGRDEDVSTALKPYQTWLSSIGASKEATDELRNIRWTDVFEEGEGDDLDVDITAMLNEDDPRLLWEALQWSVQQAFDTLYTSFASTFKEFGPASQGHKAAFMLKVIRLVRRDIPPEFSTRKPAFAQDIVPQLQDILTTEVATHTRLPALAPRSRSSALVGRSLWEGDPECPVQPSPSTFKFLRRLVGSMDGYGPGLWDASTVRVLKGIAQTKLSEPIEDAIKVLAPATSESKSSEDAPTDDQTPHETPPDKPDDNEAEAQNTHDRKVQLFFDTVYLATALADQDAGNNQLLNLAEKIRSGLETSPQAVQSMQQGAQEYWKRTQLLFGLLAVGSEK